MDTANRQIANEVIYRSLAEQYSLADLFDQAVMQIDAVKHACTLRTHAMAFLEGYMLACLQNIKTLHELDCGGYYHDRLSDESFNEQMGRVERAWRLLEDAMEQRRNDDSPQAKFGEVQLSARKALEIDHDPGLDEFSELRLLVRKKSSYDVSDYSTNELRFGHDKFLDVIQMLAHDQANPAEVPNPPARIRFDVKKKQLRAHNRWRRDFGQSPDQPDIEAAADEFFEAPRMDLAGRASDTSRNAIRSVESSEIANIDLKRGIAGLRLPPDQARLVDAMLNGLDLQSAKAAESLGWNPARLARVRRSLEPGRTWGDALRNLRSRFAAYNPAKTHSK
jgi:hypothetical protein